MVPFDRLDEPQCLKDNAAKWNQEFKALRETDQAAAFSWKGKSRGDILDPLLRATGNRCAFCDGPVGAESRETIEHFRPKSRIEFAHLAYAWVNLFPACDMCQSRKREQWDELLLKPDLPDYTFERYFVAQHRTGEIAAAPYASAEEKQRAEKTIQLYGLNLPARVSQRLRAIRNYPRTPRIPLEDCDYRHFLRDLE